jgi:hypothetical protein
MLTKLRRWLVFTVVLGGGALALSGMALAYRVDIRAGTSALVLLRR